MGYFGGYKGRCMGRVLNVLKEYVGSLTVEQVTVGDGVIYHGRNELAHYVWEDGTDWPVFSFWNERYDSIQKQKSEQVKELLGVTNLMEEQENKIKELQDRLFCARLAFQMMFPDHKGTEAYEFVMDKF